jgi:prevent-host-death family protein
MKTLEASKISAEFAKFLDEVHSLHTSFRIVKNGVPYGYLVPASQSGCNSHELADDLEERELSAEDRHEFAAAIKNGRKALEPLKNPWG